MERSKQYGLMFGILFGLSADGSVECSLLVIIYKLMDPLNVRDLIQKRYFNRKGD
ncbi:hypothetical protein [Bacillus paranthracis]|uniref:hypothetical protein n=1 Tax=Bacillus paranthracis TaxID=2026186 RepID=UPI00146D97C8|nr:hypothetical protein [Bacillus paranthracis]